jgi:hypothetical protein
MARGVGTVRGVLVVGCARSGTTLLQALLAGHPRSRPDNAIYELYDSMFYFDQADYVRRGRFACTANAFTLASVIRRVGPFDAGLKSGGDREWGNRVAAAGYAVAF